MSLAELKKHVRSAKTESSEKNAVIKYLSKLGHRTIPSVSSHKNGKYTVRIYLWKNTPIGDLALMAGPSVEGDLHSVIPVVGDVHSEDVLLYVPKKGSQAAYAAFRTGKGPSAQAIANTSPARRRARFSATSPSYDFGQKSSRSRSNRRGRRNPIDTDKVKRAYKDYVAALEEIVEAAEAQGLEAETSRVCPNGVIYWNLGLAQAKDLSEATGRGSIFRAPHSTVSGRGMEGEVSLAQGGILYLDGIEQYRRASIAALAAALKKNPNVVVIYTIEHPNYSSFEIANVYRKMLGVSPLHLEEEEVVAPEEGITAEKLVEMIQEVSLTGDEASALDAIDAAATPVLREAYRLIVAGGRSRHEPGSRAGLVDELKMKVQEHYNEWSDSGGGAVEVEEVEEGWERHFEPGSYLYNFFKEKDIPEVTFTPTDSTGEKHFIPNEVVVEHIAKTYGSERTQIEDTLRKIDFANGDVNHFLEHLAGAIAEKYVKFAPPGQVGPEPVEDFDADLARELEALMGEEEAPAPVEAAPAPPAGSPAAEGTGKLTPADLREKLRKRREARKGGSSAPKTMEEEMLEVMGLMQHTKNPRRRPSAAQRQAWMRKYTALTGDPQPKPHDYWDGATYHFLSGKSPEEAAKLFMRKNTGRGRSARRRGGYRSNPALGGKARTTIIAYITRQGHGDVAEGVVEAVNTAVKDRDESPAEIAKLIMQHVPKLVEVYKRRAAEAVPEPAVAPPVVAPAGISAAEAEADIKRRIIVKIKEAQAAGQEIRSVGPQRAAPAPQEAAAPSWIKPGARAFQTAHPEYGTWVLERDSHGQWNAKKAYPASGSIATSVSELVEFWEPGDAPAAAPTQHPAPSPSAGTASSGKLTPEDLRAKLAARRRARAAKKNPRRRTRRY